MAARAQVVRFAEIETKKATLESATRLLPPWYCQLDLIDASCGVVRYVFSDPNSSSRQKRPPTVQRLNRLMYALKRSVVSLSVRPKSEPE